MGEKAEDREGGRRPAETASKWANQRSQGVHVGSKSARASPALGTALCVPAMDWRRCTCLGEEQGLLTLRQTQVDARPWRHR